LRCCATRSIATASPLSPRIKLLRNILEKLGIRSTLAMPSPAPKPKSRPVAALGDQNWWTCVLAGLSNSASAG
jgi:hypothetical protein